MRYTEIKRIVGDEICGEKMVEYCDYCEEYYCEDCDTEECSRCGAPVHDTCLDDNSVGRACCLNEKNIEE